MIYLFRRSAVAALLLLVLPVVASPQDRSRRTWSGDNAHIRIGNDYVLPAGSTLTGPLFIVGGDTTLNGIVEDNVTTVGGDIEVGPEAEIRGDLRSIGGDIHIDPAAQVTGRIDQVRNGISIGGAPVDIRMAGTRFWNWFAAWLTIVRLALVFVVGVAVALFAPSPMRTVARRAASAPGVSFIAGMATEMLATPAIGIVAVALLITIVGIPLLALIPLLVGALILLWIAGFAAVAANIGAWARRGTVDKPVADFLIGFLIVSGLTMIGQVLSLGPGWLRWVAVPLGALGLATEYIVWTIGLGAAVVAVITRGRGLVPPPLPPRVDEMGASAPA